MRPAALIDIDGTLVDSNYQHVTAWNDAFRAHGIVIPMWTLHRAVGMGGDRFVAEVAGAEIEEALGDALRARHTEAFSREIAGVAPLPGAERLVTGLVATGHRVVLCSSAGEDEVEVYVRLLGVSDIVAWTTSADVSATKPAPELVRVALDRIGGGSAVMVGDTVWDVEAAAHVGIPTIGLLSGGTAAADLEDAGAVVVLRDADDLMNRLDETPLGSAALASS
jgi:phosphoglycolate phosphatase-like HAD superfamily hydrolase